MAAEEQIKQCPVSIEEGGLVVMLLQGPPVSLVPVCLPRDLDALDGRVLELVAPAVDRDRTPTRPGRSLAPAAVSPAALAEPHVALRDEEISPGNTPEEAATATG